MKNTSPKTKPANEKRQKSARLQPLAGDEIRVNRYRKREGFCATI
jgi:hypothetical protein